LPEPFQRLLDVPWKLAAHPQLMDAMRPGDTILIVQRPFKRGDQLRAAEEPMRAIVRTRKTARHAYRSIVSRTNARQSGMRATDGDAQIHVRTVCMAELLE
jgi:hypothetical protein